MAARKEPPSRDAMLKKRVVSLKAELTALNKAGKGSGKTFYHKLDRLKKYEKALRPKKAYKKFDYSAGRKAKAKAGLGPSAVAALIKKKQGPLRQVLETTKKGAARAKEAASQGSDGKGSVSREAYEKYIRSRK